MQAFEQHQGIALALLTDNIDTDAIIPSREMKRVSKAGLGEGLFANWRYQEPGSREPSRDFPLNQPVTEHATILLAGRNFGCGSSREHAVWALREFGFRVLIAESFGAIFQKNCIANGIVTAVLSVDEIAELAQWCTEDPQAHQLEVTLPDRTIRAGERSLIFGLEESDQRKLLAGLDPITQTLRETDAIESFEAAHYAELPWVQLPAAEND